MGLIEQRRQYITSTSPTEKPSQCPPPINVTRPKIFFKNEQRSKDAAAKKRPNTSGVGKINNYYEDIYIPPYNNTD